MTGSWPDVRLRRATVSVLPTTDVQLALLYTSTGLPEVVWASAALALGAAALHNAVSAIPVPDRRSFSQALYDLWNELLEDAKRGIHTPGEGS